MFNFTRDLKYTKRLVLRSLYHSVEDNLTRCSRKFSRKSVSIAVFSAGDNRVLTGATKGQHREEVGHERGGCSVPAKFRKIYGCDLREFREGARDTS